jgi:prepilin-type N-terminal cleavage/methylation domain-containing protein
MRDPRGFTLIEMLVVVAIVALMSTFTLLAINQSSDRRYASEAERLLIWLQQTAQHSVLEGAAYGLIGENDEASELIVGLKPVVFYRKRWVEVSLPESFILRHNGNLDWSLSPLDSEPLITEALSKGSEIMAQYRAGEDGQEKQILLPDMVFLPDGYVEPQGTLVLVFDAFSVSYIYRWDTQKATMIMEVQRL